MRHQGPDRDTNFPGDTSLDFWWPVHKLFDGTACLRGLDLRVRWTASHVHEKVRRIHIALGDSNPPTTPPFRFMASIAEFAVDPDLGPGLLVPVPHERLVEPATIDGQCVTFTVPESNGSFFASFEPGTGEDEFGEVRPVPAYVHARTEVKDGALIDFTTDPAQPDVQKTVRARGYEALHYLDHTGEGQVVATCDSLVGQGGIASDAWPAYSLVAAPDPFPSCGQRELSASAESKEVPDAL